MGDQYYGRSLVPGHAAGEIVHSTVPLSFWMGIDVATGVVIDRHHPLCGRSVKGKILVLPGGRGSCTGSCGLVELIMSGAAPAALVFEAEDPILALGSLLAGEVFGKSIPVLSVGRACFRLLAGVPTATVSDDRLEAGTATMPLAARSAGAPELRLSGHDHALLEGAEGPARQSAMRIIRRFAEIVSAGELIDIEQAHIDCCFYTGPAGLAFAEQMVSLGGRVSVPTTTNASSIDRRRWRALGIDPAFAGLSERVAQAYVSMGARDCFTCAPYLLDGAPQRGSQIAWGESNAVAYANSVIGARTMKYPDLLEVCVALTGRAPLAQAHLDDGRRASLHIAVDAIPGLDDAFYPLLGYHTGALAGHEIPVITGLEAAKPDTDDLKAFSAAFATTSGSPMFHMVGVTPESPALAAVWQGEVQFPSLIVTREDLRRRWNELNSASSPSVGLVSLGNPHFSLAEIARTAELCHGRRKGQHVSLRITCGRHVHELAAAAGYVTALESFGAEFLTDTCWCMVDAAQLSAVPGAIMTNSAKFAHYGPGITGRQFHFGSLGACIAAACSGENRAEEPAWLSA